jgi:hypothetical protein
MSIEEVKRGLIDFLESLEKINHGMPYFSARKVRAFYEAKKKVITPLQKAKHLAAEIENIETLRELHFLEREVLRKIANTEEERSAWLTKENNNLHNEIFPPQKETKETETTEDLFLRVNSRLNPELTLFHKGVSGNYETRQTPPKNWKPPHPHRHK